jgi:YVTN family beta-propeller protein
MNFRILGPLDVRANGEPLRIGGPKQRALLAILLLSANEVVSRERLMDELFRGEPPDTLEHALTVRVSRLRKALDREGSERSRVVTRPPGYLLRVEPRELDLHCFESLAAEGREALDAGDAERAAEKLREGESLWRGRALSDLEFEPFARLEIERLAELRTATVEERIDAELALARHAALAAELEALVQEHPLRERLRAQLMLALYRCGRQAEALAAYREARMRLNGELGLNPGPQLRRLEHAILRQDEALELPSDHGPALAVATARDVSRPAPGAPEGPRPVLGRTSARVPRGWVGVGLALGAALAAVGFLFTAGRTTAKLAPIRGNAVAFVSPLTGRVSPPVSLGAAPTSMTAGFGSLWVTQSAAGTVSRVDLRTRTIRQTIRVGGGPSAITVAAGDVWVANTLDGSVSRIDPNTEAVVQTIPVGGLPSALTSAADAVWVANSEDGTVTRLDPNSGRVDAVVTVGKGPSGLAYADGAVWATNQDAGTLSRIDARSDQLIDTIDAGDAPSAIVAAAGSVWVTDTLDSTISRVDTTRDAVVATIWIGGGPGGIAAMNGAVWVTSKRNGNLLRIDPRRGVVTRATAVGQRAGPLAASGGHLWIGVVAGGSEHSGGTLTVVNVDPPSIDPIGLGPTAATNDGLVSLNHVPGPDGAQPVPDLALSLPAAAAAAEARTYTFRLRPGIRYSNGQSLRAGDVRSSFERLFTMQSPETSTNYNIVGARGCIAHRRCDLSHGIVTDDKQGTVTFHLTAPDPDFLLKLAQPDAYVLPASTPRHEARSPLPATGPYKVGRYEPGREIRLVRNPYFHQWSSAAQPAGYPDQIVWELGLSPARSATLIERGQADLMPNIGPPPHGSRTVLATRFPSQLHVNPYMLTDFFFLNTRAEPFDDVRVRRALNYAIDRNRIVQIYGGSDFAQPTCQILPPDMLGYRRYCPYTRDSRSDGRWLAPDLQRARRLVAASGTTGMKVNVWDTPAPQIALDEGRYLTALLRQLGYRASLHLLEINRFFAYTNDSINNTQVVSGGWSADYPSPSDYIGRLTCASYTPHSTSNIDNSEFCDPGIDTQIARAESVQATNPASSEILWARLDRELTDRAIWLPAVNGKETDATSKRVGNYQYHPFWGALIDQLWVR